MGSGYGVVAITFGCKMLGEDMEAPFFPKFCIITVFLAFAGFGFAGIIIIAKHFLM